MHFHVMTDNQYIIDACEALVVNGYAKSLAFIAKKCGKTSQYFTDLKKGKAQYSLEFLDVLVEKFPINKEYVLTGKGEKLRSNVITEVDPQEMAQQIGQGFFERVLKLIQSGDLYPSKVVEGYKDRISELENETGNLQREIGRLEAEVKELKNK